VTEPPVITVSVPVPPVPIVKLRLDTPGVRPPRAVSAARAPEPPLAAECDPDRELALLPPSPHAHAWMVAGSALAGTDQEPDALKVAEGNLDRRCPLD
jgi:hypothetical protein